MLFELGSISDFARQQGKHNNQKMHVIKCRGTKLGFAFKGLGLSYS